MECFTFLMNLLLFYGGFAVFGSGGLDIEGCDMALFIVIFYWEFPLDLWFCFTLRKDFRLKIWSSDTIDPSILVGYLIYMKPFCLFLMHYIEQDGASLIRLLYNSNCSITLDIATNIQVLKNL